MSTLCLTVHDLRILLGAHEEDHTCHTHDHGYPEVIIEDKTVDHWSRYQLQPEELDLRGEEIERKVGRLAERRKADA